MREYGTIAPTFWTRGTGKKLRAYKDGRILATYLMTGPQCSMSGIYHASIETMASETGLTVDEVRAALARLESPEFDGFASYDEDDEVVWVPNLAREQVGETLARTEKRLRGPLLRSLQPFRKHRFHAEFIARYRDAYDLDAERAPSGAVLRVQSMPKPIAPKHSHSIPINPIQSRSCDQDQDQDQDQDPPNPQGGGGASSAPPEPESSSRPVTHVAAVAGSKPSAEADEEPTDSTPPTPSRMRAARVDAGSQQDGCFGMADNAYADGITRVTGIRFALTGHAEARALQRLVATHCPPGVVGEARLAWVRSTAEAFARANEARYGFRVERCVTWLNSGRPDARAPLAGTGTSSRAPPDASVPRHPSRRPPPKE